MKPWKSAFPGEDFQPFAMKLQWGHGDEAVEEAADVEPGDAVLMASMGPRR